MELAVKKINELLKPIELLEKRNTLPFRSDRNPKMKRKVQNNFFKIFASLFWLLILILLFNFLW